MKQELTLAMVSILILFIIISTIACITVVWQDIYIWIRLVIYRYIHLRRIAMLEKKSAALEKPPKATFFSRVNGEYTTIEGPEEEQYLSKRKKGK